MKKGINQSEGVNQVALINSNDNQVTIINSPNDYMSWLIKNGEIEEAVEVFAKVYKQTEKLHPLYPLYTYKPIEVGSKFVFEHSPANKTIAEKLPLQFRGKFTINDRDFNDGETLGEFFTRKYFSQEKISLDMKYIETWIGEQLIEDSISIEQHAVNDGEWFILPRELPPPIKAKLVLTEQADRVIIDYLELRVTEVNNKENRIEINNNHQENSPIIVTLTIPSIFMNNTAIGNSSKFNIKIRENYDGKIIAEKTFLEFMKYVELSSRMSLIDVETQKLFFTAESIKLDNPEDIQDIDNRLSLLTDLLRIESVLHVEFQLPEIIYEEDFEKIQILKAIVEEKEITTKIENFSAVFDNKDALQKMVYEVKDSPIMITGHEERVIDLFGVMFENIKVTHRFENLVVKSPDRIKKKLEYLDEGETVKVEFTPGTRNIVISRYYIEG
jgi:hypothetical protein